MQIQIAGFFRSQLIWIYTVNKGRVYPGSAGQRVKTCLGSKKLLEIINKVKSWFENRKILKSRQMIFIPANSFSSYSTEKKKNIGVHIA